MTCREFENALVLRLLEPLPPEAQVKFDAHRSTCRQCAARFEKAGGLPVFIPGAAAASTPSEPAPNWPGLLSRLEESGGRRQRFFQSRLFWAVTGAAAFFLGGIAVGTGILRPGRTAPAFYKADSGNILQAYVERLDPLLTDFQAKAGGPASADVVLFEKRMTGELRNDTALLKEAARLAGHSDLVRILDEIDVLLLNLAYLQSGDREASDQLQRVIRDNRREWTSRLLSFKSIL